MHCDNEINRKSNFAQAYQKITSLITIVSKSEENTKIPNVHYEI
jgi:hypothetical protein